MNRYVAVLILRMLVFSGIAANPLAAQADSAVTKTRTATQIAKGLYTIRHADSPDAFPQGYYRYRWRARCIGN
jgi:hypothetical protein